MAGEQPVRAYDSSGRRARAAASRRDIVDAATRLFLAQGFGGTTIAAIAKESGVSTPTVYAGFGSKADLLKAAIDIALAGDDEPVTMADRPLGQWVYEAETAAELLARYAVMMGELATRAAPIYDVLVRAADAEPDLAALLADLEAQRLRASTMVAEGVRDRGGLPEGRTLAEARDLIWFTNAPEHFVALTEKRRWSTKRYVTWARTTLIRLVLEPPVPA